MLGLHKPHWLSVIKPLAFLVATFAGGTNFYDAVDGLSALERCARYCAKLFTLTTSFHVHNNPRKRVLLFFTFYR